MAFQFQSVAALSPEIAQSFLVSLADLGLLIGLYLGPGLIVAIPGGTIAARFGDRRVVAIALGMMLIGALLMALGPGWGWLVAGRILAGIGGVVINVVMTKMLVDWFAGREIATAMGIFIASWPLGIALALLVLPEVALTLGLDLAWGIIVAMVLAALLVFLAIYRPVPQGAEIPAGALSARLPILLLLLAGLIWAVYNTALTLVFSFGAQALIEEGLAVTSASAILGLFTLFVGIGVPLGGIIADRTGQRDAIILAGFLGCALALPFLASTGQAAAMAFAATGLLFGLAAGPIMALPALILPPPLRALGMGIFFTVYYGVMMVGPAIGGALADRAGQTAVTLWLASAMLVLCALFLGLFTILRKRESA